MRSNGNEGERQNEGEKDDDENCLPKPSQGWFLLPSHKANKPQIPSILPQILRLTVPEATIVEISDYAQNPSMSVIAILQQPSP
jgi:hypothetical protein